MKFSDFVLNEAIPLSRAKEITRKSKGYKSLLNGIFGKNYRIIVKTDITEDEDTDSLISKSPVFNQIVEFIKKYGFTIETPEDYIRGIAYRGEDKKNPTKLGKILNKYEESTQFIRNGKRVTDKPLLDAFKNDPLRQSAKKKYQIVVSRHPYDIAGMSTDRNWTSCMDLGTDRIVYKNSKQEEGSNSTFIGPYLENPTLIAYLTDPNDVTSKGKPALKRPISRILLYPFKSQDGQVAYGLGEPYGVRSNQFYNELQKWVRNNLNKKVDLDNVYNRIEYIYYDSYEADFPTEVPPDALFDIYDKKIKHIDLGTREHNLQEGKIHDIQIKSFVENKTLRLFKKMGTVDFRVEDVANMFLYDIHTIKELYGDDSEYDMIYMIWENGNIHLNPIELKNINIDDSDYEKYGESSPVNTILSLLQEFDSRYDEYKKLFADKVEDIYEQVSNMETDDDEMILDLHELYYASENNINYIS